MPGAPAGGCWNLQSRAHACLWGWSRLSSVARGQTHRSPGTPWGTPLPPACGREVLPVSLGAAPLGNALMLACRTQMMLGVWALGESSSRESHRSRECSGHGRNEGLRGALGSCRTSGSTFSQLGYEDAPALPRLGHSDLVGRHPEPCLGCRVPWGPQYSPSWAFCPQWVPFSWCLDWNSARMRT